jgi:hypothetical protein
MTRPDEAEQPVTTPHPPTFPGDDRDPDAETTLDPETTTATSAAWIAELRRNAQRGNRSMADELGHDTTSGEADADDRLAALRRAAGDAPSARPSDPDDVADRIADLADSDDDERTIERPRPSRASAPPTAPVARLAADRDDRNAIGESPGSFPPPEAGSVPPPPAPADPDTPPAGMIDRSTSDETSAPGPRWEPPPRLAAATTSEPAALVTRTEGTRRIGWPVIAVVALIAVIIGFAIALLVVDDGSGPSDPAVSTTDVAQTTDGNSDDEAGGG